MSSLLKKLTSSLRQNKSKEKSSVILDCNVVECEKCDGETTQPSSSNVTSITSLGNPAGNCDSKSSQCKSVLNNHSDLLIHHNTNFIKGDNRNEYTLLNCLSDFEKEKHFTDTLKSFTKLKSEIENRNFSSSAKESETVMSNIKLKLIDDHENLLTKNGKLKEKYEKSRDLNEFLKTKVVELEQLNQKLMTDNAEILHEAIKHRFLKLESEDLSKKTNQYKQKLEEKENLIVKFQKQFENIRVKSNTAYKQKEEAQLEASHSCVKLRELADDCAQLDIYRNENTQRKYYFNQLQSVLGNVRVYLKIKPTVNESCISFLGDDKILLATNDRKTKSLICQFSHIFQPQTTNKDIFDEIEPLLGTVIDGYNCCFILYGQLDTGKTSTIFGEESNDGVLHYTLDYLMSALEENTNWEYKISLSAVQINKNLVTDILRESPVHVVDDGQCVILKNTDDNQLTNYSQCIELIKILGCKIDSSKRGPCVKRSFSHTLIIIRIVGSCKMTQEKSNGILMFCELAGFENENNLKFASRECLKEEKIIQDNLFDLGKTLITLKSNQRKMPRSNCILTKLLRPCLTKKSKCCLLIHTFSDVEEQNTITKSIQYGLAVMPKLKTEEKRLKYTVQWNFCEENW